MPSCYFLNPNSLETGGQNELNLNQTRGKLIFAEEKETDRAVEEKEKQVNLSLQTKI